MKGAKRTMGGFGGVGPTTEGFCIGVQALILLFVGPLAFRVWMMMLVSKDMKDVVELKNQLRRIVWHCIPLSIICLLVGTLLSLISPVGGVLLSSQVGGVIFLLLGAWLLVNGVRYLRKYSSARDRQSFYWESGYARVRRDDDKLK